MGLKEVRRIALPAHSAEGGFDHAAVFSGGSRLYVAHTSNDAVEVVDLAAGRFSHSLPSLNGVAGVWISEERRLLFTSNRGDDTATIFDLAGEKVLRRVATGSRPNGMAFDPGRGNLLVAGVGNRDTAAPPSVTLFSVPDGRSLQRLTVPGRTRWALFHAPTDSFYVNIADPASIARIDASDCSRVDRFIDVPAVGPHGLEQDPDGTTLYCACDGGELAIVDLASGVARLAGDLAGPPDVLWLNPRLGHLYVAIGEPGVVQVFRTRPFGPLGSVATGPGAHTLTVDPTTDEVHVFLPETHEDLVLRDSVDP